MQDGQDGQHGQGGQDGQVPPLLVPGWPRGVTQRCLGKEFFPIFATSFSIVLVGRLFEALARFLCPSGLPQIAQI